MNIQGIIACFKPITTKCDHLLELYHHQVRSPVLKYQMRSPLREL
ncbi:hypothetical protein [Brasilonema sp. UFV-L1]|nr:hypothetical protein [Brasilonema sp. UFV-L1]